VRIYWSTMAIAAWLLAGAAGCEGRMGPGDAGLSDADGYSGDDGDGGSGEGGEADAPADSGPPKPWRVGSEDTFEVAAWNIRNFPTNVDTPERVAALVDEMDLDLVAVEEIADEAAFRQTIALLPRHDGLLSEDEYSPGNYQKTGFIYRRDLIQIRSTISLFQSDPYAFPRPPLQAELYLHRPGGQTQTLIAIVVHLKASVGEENEARRRAACEALKSHVDNLVNSGTETEVIVMGDFNDSLDDPPEDDVFTVFQDAPADYRFLDQPLVDIHEYSYVPAHVLIDHLLVTADLFDDFADGEVQAVPLDALIQDYDYVSQISDHRPIAIVVPW